MLGTGPEIAGIALAVLTGPDADKGFIVAALDAVIADPAAVVKIIMAQHAGGAVMRKCFFSGPVDAVCGLVYCYGKGAKLVQGGGSLYIKIDMDLAVTGQVNIGIIVIQIGAGPGLHRCGCSRGNDQCEDQQNSDHADRRMISLTAHKQLSLLDRVDHQLEVLCGYISGNRTFAVPDKMPRSVVSVPKSKLYPLLPLRFLAFTGPVIGSPVPACQTPGWRRILPE